MSRPRDPRTPPPPRRPGLAAPLPRRRPSALALAGRRLAAGWPAVLIGQLLLVAPLVAGLWLAAGYGWVPVGRLPTASVWADTGEMALLLLRAFATGAVLVALCGHAAAVFSAVSMGARGPMPGVLIQTLGRLVALAPLMLAGGLVAILIEAAVLYLWESGRALRFWWWGLGALLAIPALVGLSVRVLLSACLVTAEGAPARQAAEFWRRSGATEPVYAWMSLCALTGLALLLDYGGMALAAQGVTLSAALGADGRAIVALGTLALALIATAVVIAGHHVRMRYTPHFRVVH